MEPLFSPRAPYYRDLSEEDQGGLESVQQLNLDVSTEELLSAERAFTYTNLYAMLGNGDTVLWLSPHANVMRQYGGAILSCSTLLAYRFLFNVDGKEIFATASSSAAHSENLIVVGALLVANASDVYELEFRKLGRHHQVFFNAPTFVFLLEQFRSLKVLSLTSLEMDEDQIRALGALSRPGLEIKLKCCRILGASAAVLAQVLGRNQGPTKLHYCKIDAFDLSIGLRGNSRLKSFTAFLSGFRDVVNQKRLAIAGALKENKGLVDLELWYDFRMSDETWDAVCDSLKTHPTLQVLHLQITKRFETPALPNSRRLALMDMLKVNMLIHTIRLHHHYRQHELFRESVVPYVERNRFRPGVRAIQKTYPIAYRAKVLGRALFAVRTDPNRLWMLLSGNAEIAFPSTSNAAVLPAAVTGASAANVATPTACLKRKARP
jgi:hypothetical protein